MTTSLTSGATPTQVAQDLAPLLDFQPNGVPLDELKSLIHERLMPHLMRYDQTHFQSMFNAFPSAEAKLGAQIALETNQGVTNWQVSPGGALLEDLCCRALCKLFDLNTNADATFMFSGTYANQQAVYLALHRHAERQGVEFAKKGIGGFADPSRLAILVSADAHMSLRHAVRMLGLGEDSLILLPVDANRRIDAAQAEQIVADIKDDRDIFCLVATTGTTSTGSVDPIMPLADLADEVGAWFHLDGAYGYAYKLVPEWAHLFEGDARADSISWDPHKQMGAPIPNSVLFVKDRADFGRMSLHSGYFNRAEDVEPNPGLKSPPTTRPMSALPLVTILRGRGLARVVEDLRQPLIAMRDLAAYLHQQPHIEVCHEPDTGILCFRMTPPNVPADRLSQLQRQLYEQVMASGERSISTTKLNGEIVLRLVSVSPYTRFAHLRETIDMLQRLVSQR
ncbi:MAG: pyridoxal phosphate-dependent decarboxylase family protein [Candidatus Promineifilaceae bacterium]